MAPPPPTISIGAFASKFCAVVWPDSQTSKIPGACICTGKSTYVSRVLGANTAWLYVILKLFLAFGLKTNAILGAIFPLSMKFNLS